MVAGNSCRYDATISEADKPNNDKSTMLDDQISRSGWSYLYSRQIMMNHRKHVHAPSKPIFGVTNKHAEFR